MPARFNAPEACPVCGESVPRGAAACPGCGADERTGWNEEATRYDGLDLPDAAFADEDSERAARKKHSGGLWLVIAIGLLLLLTITFVFR